MVYRTSRIETLDPIENALSNRQILGFKVDRFNSPPPVKIEIMTIIQEIIKIKTIIFTGHSLGGAIATLAYVKFSELLGEFGIYCELVTFGAPRVGKTKFVEAFDQILQQNLRKSKLKTEHSLTRFGRFVYKSDPVPNLPNLATGLGAAVYRANRLPLDLSFSPLGVVSSKLGLSRGPTGLGPVGHVSEIAGEVTQWS